MHAQTYDYELATKQVRSKVYHAGSAVQYCIAQVATSSAISRSSTAVRACAGAYIFLAAIPLQRAGPIVVYNRTLCSHDLISSCVFFWIKVLAFVESEPCMHFI